MPNEETRGRRRGASRWEPANDRESRRWHGPRGHPHGEHVHEDDDERGPRLRGRRRFNGPGFGGPFPAVPPFPGDPMLGVWMHKTMHKARGRARRGDVRAAALALIAEEPRNGYQIIQEISGRSGGVWRPSPGSVYPALQQLEDEGLIRTDSGDGGRRAYQLTDEGRSYAEAHADELRTPWADFDGPGSSAIEMRSLIAQVAAAAVQVLSAGTEAQAAQARQVLADTRRALYRILAADEDEPGAGGAED
jgi:DNA-binding PadR family transcriptional regulator